MFRFFSFFLILIFSFVLEGSVLLPFGLSPGGFFVSFLVFISGLFFLIGDVKWLFLFAGGAMAGVFSAMPLVSFLLFICAGVFFLFVKPLIPIEGAFSFLAALWFGAALHIFASSLLWGAERLFGFSHAVVFSSFVSFFASVAFFALGALLSFSIVWWLFLFRKRNTQSYMLR